MKPDQEAKMIWRLLRSDSTVHTVQAIGLILLIAGPFLLRLLIGLRNAHREKGGNRQTRR